MKTFHQRGLVGMLTVFALLLLWQPVHAQWGRGETGNGKVIEQNRDHSGFESVSISSGMNLYLTQSNTFSVVVRTDENIQDNVLTRVSKGTLQVKIDGSLRSVKTLEVHVSMPNIRSLAASGGSDIFGQGNFNVEDLSIAVSGGSDVELSVNGTSVDVAISGGSDVVISGSMQKLNAAVSGGSDLKAKDLKVAQCAVSASGGSDAWVNASDRADLNASGASDIYIYGNPSQLKQHASSASDIHRKGR